MNTHLHQQATPQHKATATQTALHWRKARDRLELREHQDSEGHPEDMKMYKSFVAKGF